jgi:hypothetical protein
VPILPTTLKHFLEAPVPFIMGLHAEFNADYPEVACFANIDSGVVVLHGELLPKHPASSTLVDDLRFLMAEQNKKSTARPSFFQQPSHQGMIVAQLCNHDPSI